MQFSRDSGMQEICICNQFYGRGEVCGSVEVYDGNGARQNSREIPWIRFTRRVRDACTQESKMKPGCVRKGETYGEASAICAQARPCLYSIPSKLYIHQRLSYSSTSRRAKRTKKDYMYCHNTVDKARRRGKAPTGRVFLTPSGRTDAKPKARNKPEWKNKHTRGRDRCQVCTNVKIEHKRGKPKGGRGEMVKAIALAANT